MERREFLDKIGIGVIAFKAREFLNPIPENCVKTEHVVEGPATYYTWAGCVGCHPNRVMANGEILNDDALTFAYNYAPLNSYALVENTATGDSVVARITDTGGFTRYGFVADLSNATRSAINGEGITPVRITLLNCIDSE